jgi:DNA polymerase-3 subunit epsilon
VLPAHLDPSLIDRLPEAPGVFIVHGNDDTILHAGKAGNLKLHVLNYFRLDRTSQKALDVSQRVTNITWRTTRGAIGAHLLLKALANVISPAHRKRHAQTIYSWRLMPGEYPCIELVRLSERSGDDECYGMFESERKAHNALLRLAMDKCLCHAILGIRETPAASCTGCAANERSNCGFKTARIRQFTKAVVALAPLRVMKWPYDGPIGVRERSDLHIIDNWRYLGTAQSESEIHQVLEMRRADFDEATFAFIAKTLSRLPPKRIVRLPAVPAAGTDAYC